MANSKVELASGEVLIDLTGDTVEAAALRNGYTAHDKAGNPVTGTIPEQAAKTVTPGASAQTAVAAGVYTTGAVTVAGDANLKAANIANGVSIFGVVGTLKAGASNIVTGSFTLASDMGASFASSGYLDIVSTTDLGFVPQKFAVFPKYIGLTANYIALAMYESGGGSMDYCNLHLKCSTTGSAAFSYSASEYNWTLSSAYALRYSSNKIQIKYGTSYKLKSGEWYWIAVA